MQTSLEGLISQTQCERLTKKQRTVSRARREEKICFPQTHTFLQFICLTAQRRHYILCSLGGSLFNSREWFLLYEAPSLLSPCRSSCPDTPRCREFNIVLVNDEGWYKGSRSPAARIYSLEGCWQTKYHYGEFTRSGHEGGLDFTRACGQPNLEVMRHDRKWRADTS